MRYLGWAGRISRRCARRRRRGLIDSHDKALSNYQAERDHICVPIRIRAPESALPLLHSESFSPSSQQDLPLPTCPCSTPPVCSERLSLSLGRVLVSARWVSSRRSGRCGHQLISIIIHRRQGYGHSVRQSWCILSPTLVTPPQTHAEQGGANVILTARRGDALQNVAEQCVAAHKAAGVQHGGSFVPIVLDVSDKNQIASFFDKVPAELRNIDVLGRRHHRRAPTHLNTSLIVNNAGYVVGVDRVGDLSLENMENMFATNVFGLIALTQLFIKGAFSAWPDFILLIALQISRQGRQVMSLTSAPLLEESLMLEVVFIVRPSTRLRHLQAHC